MFRRKPKLPDRIDWLLVGLGNPGQEYVGTRHNIGFDVVERLARSHGIKLDKSKHRSRFGIGAIGSVAVAIAKPMTYMNLSGQAVKPLLREFGLTPDRMVIVADETDLALGRVRIRESGSHGGHNGHRSLIESLATRDYIRIRIGIGRVDKADTIDHVLGRFDSEEAVEAVAAAERAVSAIECILEHGVSKAMNEFSG